MIAQRNELFHKTLAAYLNNRVRLVGDKNAPRAILDDEYELAVFVHNFDVYFCQDINGENLKFKFKMDTNNPNALPDEESFMAWLTESDRNKTFRIKLEGTDLYVAGIKRRKNYKTGQYHSYPLFSQTLPHIYFKNRFAREMRDKIQNSELVSNMNLKIV